MAQEQRFPHVELREEHEEPQIIRTRTNRAIGMVSVANRGYHRKATEVTPANFAQTIGLSDHRGSVALEAMFGTFKPDLIKFRRAMSIDRPAVSQDNEGIVIKHAAIVNGTIDVVIRHPEAPADTFGAVSHQTEDGVTEHRITVPVNSSMEIEDVAAAVAAAINDDVDCPVRAVVDPNNHARVELAAKVMGSAGNAISYIIVGSGTTPEHTTRRCKITLDRNMSPGQTLKVVVNAIACSAAYAGDTQTTLAILADTIRMQVGGLNAVTSDATSVTIVANEDMPLAVSAPANDLVIGPVVSVPVAASSPYTVTVEPAHVTRTCVATLSGAMNPGQTIKLRVNGTSVQAPYHTDTQTTLGDLATTIDALSGIASVTHDDRRLIITAAADLNLSVANPSAGLVVGPVIAVPNATTGGVTITVTPEIITRKVTLRMFAPDAPPLAYGAIEEGQTLTLCVNGVNYAVKNGVDGYTNWVLLHAMKTKILAGCAAVDTIVITGNEMFGMVETFVVTGKPGMALSVTAPTDGTPIIGPVYPTVTVSAAESTQNGTVNTTCNAVTMTLTRPLSTTVPDYIKIEIAGGGLQAPLKRTTCAFDSTNTQRFPTSQAALADIGRQLVESNYPINFTRYTATDTTLTLYPLPGETITMSKPANPAVNPFNTSNGYQAPATAGAMDATFTTNTVTAVNATGTQQVITVTLSADVEDPAGYMGITLDGENYGAGMYGASGAAATTAMLQKLAYNIQHKLTGEKIVSYTATGRQLRIYTAPGVSYAAAANPDHVLSTTNIATPSFAPDSTTTPAVMAKTATLALDGQMDPTQTLTTTLNVDGDIHTFTQAFDTSMVNTLQVLGNQIEAYYADKVDHTSNDDRTLTVESKHDVQANLPVFLVQSASVGPVVVVPTVTYETSQVDTPAVIENGITIGLDSPMHTGQTFTVVLNGVTMAAPFRTDTRTTLEDMVNLIRTNFAQVTDSESDDRMLRVQAPNTLEFTVNSASVGPVITLPVVTFTPLEMHTGGVPNPMPLGFEATPNTEVYLDEGTDGPLGAYCKIPAAASTFGAKAKGARKFAASTPGTWALVYKYPGAGGNEAAANVYKPSVASAMFSLQFVDESDGNKVYTFPNLMPTKLGFVNEGSPFGYRYLGVDHPLFALYYKGDLNDIQPPALLPDAPPMLPDVQYQFEGGDDGSPVTVEDYLREIEAQDEDDVAFIVCPDDLEPADKRRINAALLAAELRATELTGLRQAITQVPMGDSLEEDLQRFNDVEGGVIAVCTRHTGVWRPELPPDAYTGDIFVAAAYATKKLHVSLADRQAVGAVPGITSTTVNGVDPSKNINLLNKIQDTGHEAVVWDPAMSSYRFLTGRALVTDQTKMMSRAQNRQLGNAIKTDLYFGLQAYKSGPLAGTLANLRSWVDNYMEFRKTTLKDIQNYKATVGDKSNNPDGRALDGWARIDTWWSPKPIADNLEGVIHTYQETGL